MQLYLRTIKRFDRLHIKRLTSDHKSVLSVIAEFSAVYSVRDYKRLDADAVSWKFSLFSLATSS